MNDEKNVRHVTSTKTTYASSKSTDAEYDGQKDDKNLAFMSTDPYVTARLQHLERCITALRQDNENMRQNFVMELTKVRRDEGEKKLMNSDGSNIHLTAALKKERVDIISTVEKMLQPLQNRL